MPSSDTIEFPRDFSITTLRPILAALYRAHHQFSYQDITLDFSRCERADPAPMVGLIAHCQRLRRAEIGFTAMLPQNQYLRRLFLNCNWAHSLCPDDFPVSEYRPPTRVPVMQFETPAQQKDAVDGIIDSILKNIDGYRREHLKAIEWSINEITDNVLMHANCPDGGFLQLSAKPSAKLIEFAVVDAGDGIPKSLKSSQFQISGDVDALSKAIEQGVTRDQSIGQGNGLWGCYRLAVKSGGKFDIHSGNATLYYTSNAGLHSKREAVPYTGTGVHCCINYNDNLIIDDILGLGHRKFDPVDRLELKYEINSDDVVNFKLKDEAESLGSRVAGKKVRTTLRNLIACSECKIRVDFSDINLISSSFADEVFGKLFLELGPIGFSNRINLSKVETTVKLLVEKAISQRISYGKLD
jgi:hypothetical protein